MRKILLIIQLIAYAVFAIGQNPVKIFNLHRDSIPSEHIYLHFDKPAYVAGETIWFKAYMFTPGITNSVSTNFIAELLNEKGDIIQTKKLPVVLNNTISSQFDIPADAAQGIYFIRAWTNYTRFFDQSYVFKKTLPVFNPANSAMQTNPQAGYVFEWFPEGGRLVSGIGNVIAYRCMTKQMNPVEMNGNLLNSKGDILGDFSTNKYGVGYFSFPPLKGEKYFAELQFPDKTKQKIELPAAADNGVVLSVADHEQGKVFTVMTAAADASAPKEVLLMAVMNNQVLLNTTIEIKENQAQGLVPTEKLPEGILNIFLFDKNNNLLAQRASYVSTENSRVPAELKTTEKGITPKAFNNWSFILPPGTTGHFSVSVTDADKELVSKNEEKIFSSLLFQPGHKQQPVNIQVKDEEVRDMFMLTGNWFNDDWTVFSKMKAQNINEEMHLPLKGKLYEQGNSKLIPDGQLNILVKTKDSTGSEFTVPVMKDGSFKLYELVYEDTARIYYQWKGAKGERTISTDLEIEKETDEYSALLKNMTIEPWVASKKYLLQNEGTLPLAAKLANEVKDSEKNKVRPFQQAVANTQTKKEGGTKDVNKRYATGAFGGLSNARVVDLITEPSSTTTGNIFDYIVGKMGGFTIEKAGGRYAIYSSRSTSTREALSGNSRGLVAGKVYLDEQETSMDNIARINLDQIALVKYFAPGSISLPGVGLSCVLAVYTKKPEDLGAITKRYLNSIVFPGYNSGQQFYSPDYTEDDKKRKDYRSTLYWNPDIKLNEGSNEIKISFYNSDHTKRFRVVLEGITVDGKLVSFEKMVE